ncbi:lasso peptide biosynthesis PqqD family chaperone [Frankia sp. AgPm24]|uniref:lasso peptide biosynthesis PqqD family chaperone n=1 Tax=Frankia sp. AgPm24 TaxID=631128 RepID=UPI0020108869|nr:lasso peptide biosynthesis PqqD family chaperone [Frankia sp. AgPm24]MCK9924807.1 lasso peptide biosynthesis PqqD family chaperone [Frankia sp. AgPm24]
MVRLRSDVVRAPTEYGAVLLHTNNGQYWTLNPSGDLVLGMLLAGGDVTAATRRLCATGDVDPDTARRDVEGLLAQLTDVGLIDDADDHRDVELPGPAAGERPVGDGMAGGRPRRPPASRTTRPATARPSRPSSDHARPSGDRPRSATGPGARLRSRLRRHR